MLIFELTYNKGYFTYRYVEVIMYNLLKLGKVPNEPNFSKDSTFFSLHQPKISSIHSVTEEISDFLSSACPAYSGTYPVLLTSGEEVRSCDSGQIYLFSARIKSASDKLFDFIRLSCGFSI